MKNKLIRISKIISHSGFTSRRDAEDLIRKGKVKINGKIFTEFFIKNNLIKKIEVAGKIIKKSKTKVWLFNKPPGYVSSNKEQKDQKSLFRLIPKEIPRVVSVGRLDIKSQGLLLLTTNPSFSTFLENPINKIKRNYIVEVKGEIPREFESSKNQTFIIDGIIYSNVKIQIQGKIKDKIIIYIELVEGKNREIRKIMSFFGLKIYLLKRVSFGPFCLGNLKPRSLEEINNKKIKKYMDKLGFSDENNIW